MAYINKEELRQLINQLKNDTDNVGILLGINRVGSGIAKLPTADVVEVETLKDWLWELAKNNVGCGNFSEVCIDLISRLDGLRRFAQERRNT